MTAKHHKLIRLNANENFYGCSPLVIKALQKKLKDVHHYPNYHPVLLESEIAKRLGVLPENIVIGGGSVRIIDGIIQTFADSSDEIITFENSFSAYSQLAEIHKRKCLFAKQENFVCRIENIFPLLHKNSRVIFIANPNNPTGTIISHNELESFLQKISNKIFVVADEAYIEYVTDKNFPESISLLNKFPNLIIARTFSKAYGLAGLRIGYAVANEKIIQTLRQTRIPFSINYLAEDAAMAALTDEKFVRQCAKKNDSERCFLFYKLKDAGYKVIESQTNFIYMHFDTDEEKEFAFNTISEKGILVCNMKIFGQEKSLRIGVGDRLVNKKIIGIFVENEIISQRF